PLADDPPEQSSGWGYRQFALEPGTFGFELADPDDLLLSYDAKAIWALPSLLCGGGLTLKLPDREWSASGCPFLMALELSRQAAELSHAIEIAEPTSAFKPAGAGEALELDLSAKTPVDPTVLARSMFELGLALAFAV